MEGGMRNAEGMIGAPWGMGGGMLVMLGMVFLVAAAAVVLALFLRRVVAGDPAERIRSGALRRLDLTPAVAAGRSADLRGYEVEGFLVIPDISGYTQFIQMSAFALAHAQYAVSALLTSVIEAAEDVLATAKIEGDAVFLYSARVAEQGQRAVSGPEVGGAVCALLRAFYRKRTELSRANACPCQACRNVDGLELKAVVHSGRLLLYDLRGHRELSGLPVIVAHRLLKSDVGLDRYVLVTDAAGQDITLPLETESKRHAQTYDGVGQVESTVYAFTVDSLLTEEIPATLGTPAKVADAARKLVEGLRALRGTTDGA